MSSAYLVGCTSSMVQSAKVIESLQFTRRQFFTTAVLFHDDIFEQLQIRDAEPHELALFSTNSNSNHDSHSYDDDDDRAWTAARRPPPARAVNNFDRPSPIKRQLQHGRTPAKSNPDRAIKAVQKLLGVYQLPRAQEHVNGLSQQFESLSEIIDQHNESIRDPSSSTSTSNFKSSAASQAKMKELDDLIKREQMEVFALKQLNADKLASVNKLKSKPSKPSPGTATTSIPGPRSRTTATTTATASSRPRQTSTSPVISSKSASVLPKTKPAPRKSITPLPKPLSGTAPLVVEVLESPGDYSAERIEKGRPSPLSLLHSNKEQTAPASPSSPTVGASSSSPLRNSARMASSPSSSSTPTTTPRKARKSASRSSLAGGTAAAVGSSSPQSATRTRESKVSTGAKPKSPVSEEELALIATKVWSGLGDVLKPWARKTAIDKGGEWDEDKGETQGFEETLETLSTALLSSAVPRSPNSPSAASFSTYTSTQPDSDPLPLPPAQLIELHLLNLLMCTIGGKEAKDVPLPPGVDVPADGEDELLPPLVLTMRDAVLPSSLPSTPSATTTRKKEKEPMISMNSLKLHLGRFARRRGWGEEMGTTAIYSLVSRTLVRIDRRGTGREGAMVGFKV
ncbi:hypothetical protein T439DRAFT_384095 [Meredithblackwellia eburnea MCA 4105]